MSVQQFLHAMLLRNINKLNGNFFCQSALELIIIRNDKKFHCKSNFNSLEAANKPENVLKPATKNVIKKLEELFNIRPYRALLILDEHKKIKDVSPTVLSDNFSICKKFKISNTVLLEHANILAQNELEHKLQLVQQLPFTYNEVLPLAMLSANALHKFVQRLETEYEIPGKRITFLAELLEASPGFVCEALVVKPFLQSKDLDKIAEDCALLQNYGVYKEDIKRDLWVLRYSTEHLQERLEFAKQNNVEQIKTWMMRATPEIFETYLKRRLDNKSVLGDNSLIEYLSNRLECPPDFAKYMVSKQPALKNKSMKKMQEIIEFLLAQGFKPMHICRVPKILLHSVETMKKRIRELADQGVQMDSLHILTKSQKQYQHYYESLVKINKLKNKPPDNT